MPIDTAPMTRTPARVFQKRQRAAVITPSAPQIQPPAAPAARSAGQCAPTAMRDNAIAIAAGTAHAAVATGRRDASTSSDASVNAVTEWPEGKVLTCSTSPITCT